MTYMDISGWQQPDSIDWVAYKEFSQQTEPDHISKVAIKINEGTAGIDTNCHQHWNNAIAAGIERIILYHYARPDLNSPEAEVASYLAILGSGLRASDFIMLDYETLPETPGWAAEWLTICQQKSGVGADRIAIYANLNAVETHLQDSRLAVFPLILADWTYDVNNIPPAPLPWHQLMALQYSNRQSVPGVGELVDADVFLHGPFVQHQPVVIPGATDSQAVDAKVKASVLSAIASLQDALKLLA